MSKIKPNRAFAKEVFTRFGGISPGGADDMRNFRILSDGSLEKRCGWELTNTLPGSVRGIKQCVLDGRERLFVVCNNGVYSIDNGVCKLLSSVNTFSGKVRFFLYRNRLYLCDGDEVFVYRSDALGFQAAQGYAPFYGYNWHPNEGGEVLEPLNLFTNRIRIHYLNTIGTNTFYLPFYVSSIECVRVDGVTDTAFGYSDIDKAVITSRSGTSIEIACTIALNSDHRRRLHHALRGFCGRVEETERLMLSAPSDGGQYLYCSTAVSDIYLNGSLAYYPDSDPLYFKSDGVLTVGNQEHPITTFFAEHDRVLAFWDRGASVIRPSPEGDTVECYPLSLDMGCTVPDLTLSQNGDPIIINEGGIFRLRQVTGEPDRFLPTLLSEGMAFVHSKSFRESAICTVDSAHGEFWFRDPGNSEGLVWVLNPETLQWYCFDGLFASLFYSVDGRLGFASDNRLCLFDDAITTDGGKPFEAIYQSGFLCFSSPESVKRSLRVTLCGFGAEAMLELESERKSRHYSILAPDSSYPVCMDHRARFGRFRHLRFCLRDNGTRRSRWSRLALYSNL